MQNKISFTGIRKACIDSLNGDGSYNIYFADDNPNNIHKNVSAITVGSFSSGIFTQFHEGSFVWVAQSYYHQPVIVGSAVPLGSIEQGSILEANDIDKPNVNSGEVILQASSGAHIDLRNTGDIKLSNLRNDGLLLSDAHRAVIVNSYQFYNINESGYTVEGRVRRFHPKYIPGQDPVFTDLLSDPEADAFTFDVARDPSHKALPINRARGTTNVLRNPAFAEKRELILEFADSFFVRDVNTEKALVDEFPQTLQQMDRSIPKRRGYGTNEQTFDNFRHSSRTNVLRLDDNVIIERVQGTLVDIFGNVLDINYNKLELPKIDVDGKNYVSKAHQALNRSIAYHFQVNSRNTSTKPTGNNKFTFDIDKEGQFKLNVPRSSTSGTTPTISTFILNNSDLTSRIDIKNTQLSKSAVSAPTGGNVGTVFHDMTLVADRLIRHTLSNINQIRQHSTTSSVQASGDTPNIEFVVGNSINSADSPAYTTTISVQPDTKAVSTDIDPAFAGGRSGLMNFEGSLEVSVGSDDVDGKSIMLDTAGALIAWLGTDDQGRSAAVNCDGAVLLNIGDYVVDDNGNNSFNPGILGIRVNLSDENKVGALTPGQVGDNKTTDSSTSSAASDHIVWLTPNGIVIASGGGTPIVLRSSGDLIMEAAGQVDIKAKNIQVDAGGYLRKISPKKGDI